MSKFFALIFWAGLISLLMYELFFGSLLFLNPIKLGIRSKKLGKVTVYTSNLYELNPIYDYVGENMARAELLYGLKYISNVNIYVATTKKEFGRWVPPWVGNNVGGVTLYTGNVIYINPEKIRQNNYNEEEFINHELVHNLIAQNSAILTNFVFASQEWFVEGVAMHFGGPNYYSENEFRTMMRDTTLIYDDKSSLLFANLQQKDPKLKFMIYKYFIDYLIEQYGDVRFKIFMKKYIESPGNYKIIFFEVYNKTFKLVTEEFERKYGIK